MKKKKQAYTESLKNKYENDLKEIKRLDDENSDKANKLKKELENKKISFTVKSGKDGKIFGTISSKQISDELKKMGYNIDKKQEKRSKRNTDFIPKFSPDYSIVKKVLSKENEKNISKGTNKNELSL